MTHEEALNFLLANACGKLDEEEFARVGYQEYMIELHCSAFLIQAVPLGSLKYNVLSVKEVK